LRRLRARAGEPHAQVAAWSDGSVRVGLGSVFDASLDEAHVWPLDPGDDLFVVGASIFSLLDECRVSDVQVAAAVRPAPAASH
jgi:hypothetical protein